MRINDRITNKLRPIRACYTSGRGVPNFVLASATALNGAIPFLDQSFNSLLTINSRYVRETISFTFPSFPV